MRTDWNEQQVAIVRMALSQLSCNTDTGAERGAIADMLAGLREPSSQDVTMGDGYDQLKILIRRGTTVNGAIVALCPDEDDPDIVMADVCIDGPPVP